MKKLLAVIIEAIVRRVFIRRFNFWQSIGVHVIPVALSPVADTRKLAKDYPKPSKMTGIDMNEDEQVQFLSTCGRFQEEYDEFVILDSPTPEAIKNASTFVLPNSLFNGIDPHVYYCMIRHFQPNQVLEIGSGFSTRVARMALDVNDKGELTCIEPYPGRLNNVQPINLVQRFLEDVDISIFDDLEANDILFIDTSHTFRIGSELGLLFLEILPRLKPGVIVHVHDIFLPQHYPPSWTIDKPRFYNEQYFLQAYLINNAKVKVLFANHFMAEKHPDLVKQTFPKALYYLWSGSFWFEVT